MKRKISANSIAFAVSCHGLFAWPAIQPSHKAPASFRLRGLVSALDISINEHLPNIWDVPRFFVFRRGMSRLDWQFSKRRFQAARLCWATHLLCANCGAEPQFS